jgi:hypothetical protein
MTRVTVALLSVLLSVGQASAECAWVLWSNFLSSNPTSRHSPSSGGLWTPEGAGTRTECEQALHQMPARAVREDMMGPGTHVMPGSRTGTLDSTGVVGPNGQVDYTCLPDTMDPRVVKGGGR